MSGRVAFLIASLIACLSLVAIFSKAGSERSRDEVGSLSKGATEEKASNTTSRTESEDDQAIDRKDAVPLSSGQETVTHLEPPPGSTEPLSLNKKEDWLVFLAARSLGMDKQSLRSELGSREDFEKLREAYQRHEPERAKAYHVRDDTGFRIQQERLKAGGGEAYPVGEPRFVDATAMDPRNPRNPREYVTSSILWDPNLKQDIRWIVRINPGESTEFDEATARLLECEQKQREDLLISLREIRAKN